MVNLTFSTALAVDNLPDEQLDCMFDVVMPKMDLIKYFEFEKFPLDSGALSKESGIFNFFGMGDYVPIVEEISFGTTCFSVDSYRNRAHWVNMPKELLNLKTVTVTLFCSNAMLAHYYVEAWKGLMYNRGGNYFYSMDNYKRDITVQIIGTGGTTFAPSTAEYILMGCFPTETATFSFKYSKDPARFRVMQTFSVDAIYVNPDKGSVAMTEELLTSPTSLVTGIF